MIKLLIGGSPCTFWSIAQKNNRETEAEGLGWELFKNYLIAKEKFKPDFFLYENNKSAAQAIKDQISRELGVDLMYINSALVSAQNRQRFYAFNWEVDQPEDRGILLRDILASGANLTSGEKGYCLTASYDGACAWNTIERSQRTMVAEPVGDTNGKAYCVTANYAGAYPEHSLSKVVRSMVAEPVRIPEYGAKDKARPINALYPNNCGGFEHRMFSENPNKQQVDMIAEPIRVGSTPRPNGELSTSQAKRVYSIDGKSVNLTANGGGEGAKTGQYAIPAYYPYAEPVELDNEGRPTKAKSYADDKIYTVYRVENGLITIKDKQYPIKLADGFYIIRKLTPVECERLQTLPDGYTKAVSNAQRYKGLGNGWTAEVIIHILNGALKDVPRDEEIVVLSMYDGIGTGRYCLDKMGFTNVKYYAYEIDKYAIQVAMSNYPDIIQCGDAFALRDADWTLNNNTKE